MKGDDRVDRMIADWNRTAPCLDLSTLDIAARIIRISSHLNSDVGDIAQKYGLGRSQFDILATLRRVGPPCELTPTELLESVLLTSGALTNRLDSLVKGGFVVRRQDRKDGRRVIVSLTKKGVTTMDRAMPQRIRAAQGALSVLEEWELGVLSGMLRKLMVHIESRE